MIRVLLVGDRSPSVLAHNLIPKALKLASIKVGQPVETLWAPTDSIIQSHQVGELKPHAIWCVPGSPYASAHGAFMAIRWARQRAVPFLGTCGGFQHALIEYAQSCLGILTADHEETNPDSKMAVINRLQCSMVERSERVSLVGGSRLREIYGAAEAMEGYHCNFGVNPALLPQLQDDNLAFSAFNDHGEVRAMELRKHNFFVGTLFQPERSAANGLAHPLIVAFLRAALAAP